MKRHFGIRTSLPDGSAFCRQDNLAAGRGPFIPLEQRAPIYPIMGTELIAARGGREARKSRIIQALIDVLALCALAFVASAIACSIPLALFVMYLAL